MADEQPSSQPNDPHSVLSYETPQAREPLRWFRQEKPWLPLLLIFCILMVLAFILIPITTRGDRSPTVACMANLRQLGLLMTQYAALHNDECPDSFETLILDVANIRATLLICPTSNDKPPTYQNATELAQRLGANGRPDNFAAASSKPSLHYSYIYCGAGLTAKSSPKSILAYEPLSNHSGKTVNFLFRDTHVEGIPAATALKMINELRTGHNPPRAEVVNPNQ
jgi:hypothetical protein